MTELPTWVVVMFCALLAMDSYMHRRLRKKYERVEEQFMTARRGLLQAHESLRLNDSKMAFEQVKTAFKEIGEIER